MNDMTSERIKKGDLVEFWDYDNGGLKLGLVLDTPFHQFCSDKGPIPSLSIMCKNTIQIIPLKDEWVRFIAGENER